MNTIRMYLHLLQGDFLERTRRYSFLITLVFALYAGYSFIPPIHANYVTLELGGHRGIYNSAWIGCLAAMHTALFISIAGFYLVKNAVAHDRHTGVGQILAATRMSKFSYIATKALSNLLVLATMIAVIIIATGGMQLLRGEDFHIHPWQLIAPFMFITLPVLAIVAAIAVLFESIRYLRGGFGNVVFFFLWMFGVSSEMLNIDSIMGTNLILNQMKTATHAAYPDYDPVKGSMNMGFSFSNDGNPVELTTFEWHGIDWTTGLISERILLYAVAFGLVLMASLFFDRFDTQSQQLSPRKTWWRRGRLPSVIEEQSETTSNRMTEKLNLHLSRLTSIPHASRFGQMLVAEVKLMLKGVSLWWLLVALGLIIVGLSLPIENSRNVLLPITWAWPILLWSKMGTCEARFRTDQILFSSPRSLWRQFPALWFAGVLLAMLTGSGVAIRLMVAGEGYALFAWVVGAMFIPTMALTMGVWSGSSKLFEIMYLLLWYAGPMNKIPGLDYMGSSSRALLAGTPNVFLVCTLLMLCLALAGRKKQLTI